MRRVIQLLALAIAGCGTSNSINEPPIDPNDATLFAALASVAKRGHEGVCDPVALESALGLVIGKLLVRTERNTLVGELIQQETDEIHSISELDAVRFGTYRRFKSRSVSRCKLEVQFSERRICRRDSPLVARIMGVPLTRGPDIPHYPRGSAYVFVFGSNDLGVRIALGDDRISCGTGFLIESNGEWK